MRLRKYQRCAICGMRTEFPKAHYLDFHYRREKNVSNTNRL